ncbi:hypothetical protein OIU77_006894 [Salix suchowensis]|uniref:Glycine-rich protein n=1 Tax=Salix suchowensis TaxID=1278906 RepID=A0ABQ9ANR6_9ROSI|nr:hypothetical protein OIU77_006894 [Salix suchowensis]
MRRKLLKALEKGLVFALLTNGLVEIYKKVSGGGGCDDGDGDCGGDGSGGGCDDGGGGGGDGSGGGCDDGGGGDGDDGGGDCSIM